MLSSKFVDKVLERIEKLDVENLKDFIYKLSQNRKFFETILESMIEGVIVLNKEQDIQYINKQAIIMFNINDSNVIEKNLFDVIHDDPLKTFLIESISNNQKQYGVELFLKNPVKKVIELSIYPFVKEGKISGNVIILLDITDRKEERLKLQRVESLASLTTLAAGIAHEIKNPLGALDIHVQLLDRITNTLKPNSKKEFKKLLKVIIEEIERMDRIVSDFLFTVRPININPKKSDILELFNSILNLLKYDFEKKNVTITLKGNPIDRISTFDSRYLKHAFINILKNSLDACKKGDSVSIIIEKEKENLIIKISDTGKGIDNNILNKIFEPYFTTKDFGTGLGLTIVYKIIKEHKGNIAVDSEKDVGTTFTFTIPCYKGYERLLPYNY